MRGRSSLLISSIVAAVLFAIGYPVFVLIPGGGEVTDADFTSFYVDDEAFALPLLMAIATLAGAWALIWFFAELRARLDDGMLTRLGFAVAVVGAAGLGVGAGLMIAPLGVQMNSDAGFVGIPIAHTFAQAGLAATLAVGIYSFAVAVLVFSVALRRTTLVPSWLTIAGIVVGVLLFASVIWMPGYLLPIWVLVIGVTASRQPASAAAPA